MPSEQSIIVNATCRLIGCDLSSWPKCRRCGRLYLDATPATSFSFTEGLTDAPTK